MDASLRVVMVWMTMAMVLADEAMPRPELLYAAEGAKAVIRYGADGREVWRHPAAMSRDAWLLPDGNVLFAYNDDYDAKRNDNPSGVIEVTPDHRVVFQVRTTGQVWSCQRLADGTTLIGAASQGRLLVADRSGAVVRAIRLKGKPGHSCLRMARGLAGGGFLVAEEGDRALREYATDGSLAWEAKVPFAPFSVVRLPSGNTLACGQQQMAEVDRQGAVVWRFAGAERPELGVRWMAGMQVLDQGRVAVCNAGGKVPFFVLDRASGAVLWCSAPGADVPGGHGIQVLGLAGPAQR